MFEGPLALVRSVLATNLFMLVRNLSGIKQVLAKGVIKDMIYDRRRKKVKRCHQSWIIRAFIGSPDLAIDNSLGNSTITVP